MRLFTALDLSPEVADALEQVLRRLRPLARISWSPVENLHVTTKFIGEWPETRLGELKALLAGVPSRGPLPVAIRGFGFRPNAHSPRHFWCGIEAPGLEELAAGTNRAAATLGIASETRPFSPHLTLARIRERIDMQPLREAIASLGSQEFGRFEARSWFLYQSTLKPGGSVYTKLAEFPLTKP
jgi:RNA 2',3'-cyclic 3'-phosphodiesterase